MKSQIAVVVAAVAALSTAPMFAVAADAAAPAATTAAPAAATPAPQAKGKMGGHKHRHHHAHAKAGDTASNPTK